MWFGILTPGAHPSRPTATRAATILCWTPGDRRRIDGPFFALHGGLRVLRRSFYAEGRASSPPRCFVCRRRCPVPDAEEVRASTDVAEAPAPVDARGPRPPATAVLAWVQLTDLDGPGDPPLDEEAVVILPGSTLAVLTPLERVPDTLGLLAQADRGGPPPACARCGTVLPGSDRQRAADQVGGTRRARRSHGRRAA